MKKEKDLHNENYKTLLKEIKEDTNKGKEIPQLWIIPNIVIHTIQSDLQIQCDIYQNLSGIFCTNGKKKIPKLAWTLKGAKIDKMTLKKKVGAFILHDFKACYAKSLQLCLTLCDPIDSSPPGSPVPGILQARTPPEWVAISLSNA